MNGRMRHKVLACKHGATSVYIHSVRIVQCYLFSYRREIYHTGNTRVVGVECMGEGYMTIQYVCKWKQEFKTWWMEVDVLQQSCWPSHSASTFENMQKVCHLLEENNLYDNNYGVVVTAAVIKLKTIHVTHYVFSSTNWITILIDAFFARKRVIDLIWRHQSRDPCKK